ncbi:hypothetical protein TNCT_473131 [Trichonephila clavata]|uniref:Uncharacterized protein n=1 Tax=Trichonephila clavata TaxID=2740835 RepID=A0A8X6G1E0_TRICU|nr:hypothetical protein TNCT_473131 [Trichonephila clavata]
MARYAHEKDYTILKRWSQTYKMNLWNYPNASLCINTILDTVLSVQLSKTASRVSSTHVVFIRFTDISIESAVIKPFPLKICVGLSKSIYN